MVSLALSTPHDPEAGLRQKLLDAMILRYIVQTSLSLDLSAHHKELYKEPIYLNPPLTEDYGDKFRTSVRSDL
jgi:hypothetical protein